MLRFLLLTLALLLAPVALATSTLGQCDADRTANRDLLDRIQKVETGGERTPATAVGDHGQACGWYQMHPEFWADAVAECPELGKHTYAAACRDRRLSELAVCAYWRKYAKGRLPAAKAMIFHYGCGARVAGYRDRHAYVERLNTAK